MTNSDEIIFKITTWQQAEDDAILVRRKVFIEEQQVPEEIEIDGTDEKFEHIVAYNSQQEAVGTARLNDKGVIGRMAVLEAYRQKGVGKLMLQKLIEFGKAKGIKQFQLGAQIHAVEFYRKSGFEPDGEEFLEAGIRHIPMKYRPIP
ncbi:MAG: GNAT family N-acetyltransferase [Sedimentisphaerales bacterium]|nr:GNAT family N-acetyltransferase [Sedimentisphaerales bacterium]